MTPRICVRFQLFFYASFQENEALFLITFCSSINYTNDKNFVQKNIDFTGKVEPFGFLDVRLNNDKQGGFPCDICLKTYTTKQKLTRHTLPQTRPFSVKFVEQHLQQNTDQMYTLELTQMIDHMPARFVINLLPDHLFC